MINKSFVKSTDAHHKPYLLFLDTHGRAPLLFCTVLNIDPADCALTATGLIGRGTSS